MAPPASCVSCLEKTVRYEPSIWAADFTKEEHIAASSYLVRHGLLKFVTHIPPFFLNLQVQQFYETLRRNPLTNKYTAEVLVYTTPDFTESEVMLIQVTDAIRSQFDLNHRGMFPHSFDETTASNLIRPAALPGMDTSGTAYNVNLQLKFKVLTKFIHNCWFGYTGSNNQISLVQKSLLASLMQEEEYSWEAAYMKVLMDEQTPPEKNKYLRQGNRVSAIILETTNNQPVYWKETVPVTDEHKLYLASNLKVHSKKAAGKSVPKHQEKDCYLLLMFSF